MEFHLAESQGFEPQVAFTTTVFKTAAFDRSANSPKHIFICIALSKHFYYTHFYYICKHFFGALKLRTVFCMFGGIMIENDGITGIKTKE